jgi:glyoxylase-like metal-dependent hydrolase (beta-lactamase superfamily II)
MRRVLQMDRRGFLGGLSSAAAAMLVSGVVHPNAARAAAAAAHEFSIGQSKVTVLSDGTIGLGLSFALPETDLREVEALLAQNGLPEDGFIAQLNVTLIRAGDELILVDAGSGSNFQDTAGKLVAALDAGGIDPESVMKVVFTHAHPDHLWGAIDEFEEPRFPNATYVVADRELDFWRHPDTVKKVPESLQGMAAGSSRILRLLESKIEVRKAGDAVGPGLMLVDTPGHTPGHVSVLVESAGEKLLVGGDVLGHPVVSFTRPDWTWGTDTDPEKGIATRKTTLAMLASERIPLLGYHLPWPGLGRVERSGNAYRFVPTREIR